MILEKYLPQDCLTFDQYEDVITVQKILLENGYCVLIGREENLWTLNWIWTEKADRNDVIFVDRSVYECEEYEWLKKHPEYGEEENDR